MTQGDLLERARKFDRQALAEIHDQFYPAIYRYVRFRVDDEPTCEDIASEVFVRFLHALRAERKIEDARGWLMGTASNLVSDYYRERYRRPQENLDQHEDVIEQQTTELASDQSFVLAELRRALHRLTPDQQHVLTLRFTQELSLEETARLIGKTINAVKVLQFRALAALRRHMAESQAE